MLGLKLNPLYLILSVPNGITHQQAIEYFFDRIRLQILTALANRKMCEDLHLMGKLALFEKDRREAVS